jgi:MoxR-like ATPase
MDHVTLSKDFGKWKAGQSFPVVKKSKTTTIVDAGNRRVILPNGSIAGMEASASPEPQGFTLDGADEPRISAGPKALVELTGPQEMVKDALDLGEDDLETILHRYMGLAKLDEVTAKKDIVFISDHLEKGSIFKVRPAIPKNYPRPAVASEMSEIEAKVLDDLLKGGGNWDAEELGVSSDTSPADEEPPELGPNQVWFTDITGGRLPKSGINHRVNQYDKEHFPESIRVDIPEVDPMHYWDPEVLEALILAHQLRERACITGLPGTGKTTSVKQFAAWIRQPYMRLGGRGDLEASSFLGYSWADVEEINGEVVSKMSFKPGMLTQGLDTEGHGYLVTIDEVMKIPAYIQMCMQHLYEKDGHLTIDDKPGTKADKIVIPAKEFLLILTDNVKGTGDSFDKFASTQMQDTSTLDRIGINETLDYLDPKDESHMLTKKFPKVDPRTIKKLVKFAGLVRNGYRQGNIALTLSPRGLESILEMIAVQVPLARAIALAYSNKIADEAEGIAIGDMLKTVGIS